MSFLLPKNQLNAGIQGSLSEEDPNENQFSTLLLIIIFYFS